MFETLIEECRSRFSAYAERKTLLGRRQDLARALRKDGVVKDDANRIAAIADSLYVTWAANIVANPGIYSAGQHDLPAMIIVSTDAYFLARPDHLLRIARRLEKLRTTPPDTSEDPVLINAARIVADDSPRPLNFRLPYRLTDGWEVRLTASLLRRSLLPGGTLATPLLPIAISRDNVEANLVLPGACWPDLILGDQAALADAIRQMPAPKGRRVTAAQNAEDEQIAIGRPYRAKSADDVLPGASRGTVSLTPRCAQFLRQAAKQNRFRKHWWVRVGGHPDFRTLDLTDKIDPRRETCVFSEEINIVFPTAEATRYRGIVIDYQETTTATGFVFTPS